VSTPSDGRAVPEIICPHCNHQHVPHVRMTADTFRRAARRPATPEVLHFCPQRHALLVLSLHPAPQEALAS
jgi:hypothetical protein